jgi:hypothetical protein
MDYYLLYSFKNLTYGYTNKGKQEEQQRKKYNLIARSSTKMIAVNYQNNSC